MKSPYCKNDCGHLVPVKDERGKWLDKLINGGKDE